MIDIICVIVIGLFAYLGWRRGFIRTAASLLGTVIVYIIAWSLKDVLADFLIEHFSFFNYAGLFNGITSINILIYKVVAFLIIFVVLYCILNILINAAKLVEKLIKITVIFALPSKILGALLGFIEGVTTVFLVAFCLYHFPLSTKMINDSKVAIIILERTPILGDMAVSTTLALEDIDKILIATKDDENKETANFRVLHQLIYYKIISPDAAQKLIDDKKLQFTNTTIVK